MTKQTEDFEAEIAQLKDEVRSLRTQLTHTEKMGSLGEIAGQIAHEINNLVSLMLTFTQSARMSNTQENIKRAFDVVIDVSAKLLHLSGSILKYSKKTTACYCIDSPVAAMEDVLTLMQIPFQKANITVEKDFSSHDNISCDVHQLQQVYINILNNAIYALKNTENPIVRVSSHADERYVYICVSDNGCGMSDEVRENIFKPFFTTKNDKESDKNNGLGLAVCRDIVVKRHLGKLQVDSEEGKGTTFTIALRKNFNLQPKALKRDKKK